MSEFRVIEGDCRKAMAAMPEASVDAIVTDPPYGLDFMGKAWDRSGVAFRAETWVEAMDVLKPGGHLLAFGGTRTYHRLTCAIEDAGFEIRDCLAWLYGSGFPKSHNIGGGLGTALKPAFEPVVMARKPLAGTVQHNWQEHGTGPLNIDGCRVGTDGGYTAHTASAGDQRDRWEGNARTGDVTDNGGRWPANVLLDEEAAALLDEQTGELHSQDPATRNGGRKPGWSPSGTERPMLDKSNPHGGDSGGASRFFYVAKASSAERNAGLEGFATQRVNRYSAKAQGPLPQQTPTTGVIERNVHPTVKPIALMRWLCRLVTPPGGIVLDPFTGSGTTGCAAVLEDFNFIGIEREAEYVAIARARIAHWWAQPVQLGLEAA